MCGDELSFLMSSLFGIFNCDVVWHWREVGWKGEGGEGGGSVQGAPGDEVGNWVGNKQCQQSGKPPPISNWSLKKTYREWSEKRWRKEWDWEKIPSTLWGKSCYWKAIKLAFRRIDWKWRGLLKERDKGTIARLWPPYVALLSVAFFAIGGRGGGAVCLSAPTKRSS